jgi:hypothetical protein
MSGFSHVGSPMKGTNRYSGREAAFARAASTRMSGFSDMGRSISPTPAAPLASAQEPPEPLPESAQLFEER